MDPKHVYALAAAQGMSIIETESCTWVQKRRFFLESAPGHRRVRLRPGEAGKLFLRGVMALRYTCDENEGAPSFEYVCTDRNFGLESLASDARRRVRRGLEACDVRRIDCDLLRREGRAINCDVFERQGRAKWGFLTEQSAWDHYTKVCSTLPNMEAYGAFVQGRLIAYSLGVFVEDYCYLFHTHAFSDFLRYSPINALTFTVMKSALCRPTVSCVSQGFESFRSLPDVERFKLSMGFFKRPIGRRVLINPIALPAFLGPGAWLTHEFVKKFKPGLADDFSAFVQSIQSRVVNTRSQQSQHHAHSGSQNEFGATRSPVSPEGRELRSARKLPSGDPVNDG